MKLPQVVRSTNYLADKLLRLAVERCFEII